MVETDEQLYSRFLACGDSADLGALLERHGEGLTLFLYGYVLAAVIAFTLGVVVTLLCLRRTRTQNGKTINRENREETTT